MSNQQAFDSVDTPARNKQNWPSPDAFYKPKPVLKFSDILPGIFKILHRFEHGESKYGKGLILKLEPLCGPILLVWAPDSLIFALKLYKDAKFVQYLSCKVDANGKKYYDFKLC